LEEFRVEFLAGWRQLPNKAFFLGLLGGWVLLFQFVGNSTLGYYSTHSLFKWMYICYNPPQEIPGIDDQHGNLIPFVVLGLFWWKRHELLALPVRTWWPALFLVGAGVFLHILGYAVQQPRISVIGFFTGLYGLIGAAWGPAFLRACFFPYFLFIFMMPFGSMGEAVTAPLRHLVAKIVTAIAHLGLAPDLVRQGTELRDAQSSFAYDIAPACSGIRSLVSLLAITTIYGFLSFKPFWKKAVMVAAAFPLAVVGNTARITFTVVVAEAFGQEAGAFVETKFGFVTFAVAIGLVFALGPWLRDPAPPKGHTPPPSTPSAPLTLETAQPLPGKP
jgi:exosortase